MNELNTLWQFHWLFIVAMFVALLFGHIWAGIIMYGFLVINAFMFVDECRKGLRGYKK